MPATGGFRLHLSRWEDDGGPPARSSSPSARPTRFKATRGVRIAHAAQARGLREPELNAWFRFIRWVRRLLFHPARAAFDPAADAETSRGKSAELAGERPRRRRPGGTTKALRLSDRYASLL